MTDANQYWIANARARAKSRITLHAGDNSVIGNDLLPSNPINGTRVVMSQDVYETLKMIGDLTNQTNHEIPFFLFGHSEGQTVIFDEWCADKSAGNAQEATFTPYLVNELNQFARNATQSQNKVFAHGHSHPRIGPGYLNYSLADINAYITMKEDVDRLHRHVDVCGCLLTGGNYNFVFFDGRDTYRFDNVFVQDNNGRLTRLPCFGPDRAMVRNYNRNRGI